MQPSRSHGLPSAFLTLALFGAAPLLPAQKTFKHALPENTLFYMGAPDLMTALEKFKTTALYRIWEEEEVQEFLADLLEMAAQRFQMQLGMLRAMHQQQMIPVDPDKILKIRVRGVSMALTDLVLPGPQNPPKVSFVMALDFGGSAKIVEEVFGLIPKFLPAAGPMGPKYSVEEVGGCEVHSLIPPKAPFFSLNWTFVRGKLLLGTDRETFKGVLTKMQEGATEGGLGSEPVYLRTTKKTHADSGVLEVFMRVEPFVKLGLEGLRLAAGMEPEISEEIDLEGVDRVVDALGLKGLKAFSAVSTWENGRGVTRSFALAPKAERKGLLALGSQKPIDKSLLKVVPKDVGSFQMGRIDFLPGAYRVILDAVSAYSPRVRKQVDAMIGMVEQEIGLSIQNDLLGLMGPEAMAWSMPVAGAAQIPEVVLALGCKDENKAVSVFKKLASMSDGVLEIGEHAGEDGTFYSLDIVLDTGGFDPTALIDPTFAFRDGRLIFGLTRQDVKGAVARFAGKGGDSSILDNPAFKPLLESIPAEISSLSFTDSAAYFDGIYGTLSGFLAFVTPPPEIPIDLGLMPSSETITKHLSGTLAFSTSDDEGFLGYGSGPLSGPEGVFLIAGIVGGVTAALVASGEIEIKKGGGDRFREALPVKRKR